MSMEINKNAKQSIGLCRVKNARELGGYACDGGTIKKGLLLRSGQLVFARRYKAEGNSEFSHDYKRLEGKYKLGKIIDLRVGKEIEKSVLFDSEEPKSDYSDAHDPVFPWAGSFNMPAMAEKWATDNPITKKNIPGIEYMKGFYRELAKGEEARRTYSGFFRELLKADDDKAFLWHCVNGKDRTGIAAVLLLAALGAGWETIEQDYMLSKDYLEETVPDSNDFIWKQGNEVPLVDVEYLEAYMEAAKTVIKDGADPQFNYEEPGVDPNTDFLCKYIQQYLEIKPSEIVALREKYLESSKGGK